MHGRSPDRVDVSAVIDRVRDPDAVTVIRSPAERETAQVAGSRSRSVTEVIDQRPAPRQAM